MEKPNKQLQNSRRFLFSLPKALKNGRLGKSAFFLFPPSHSLRASLWPSVVPLRCSSSTYTEVEVKRGPDASDASPRKKR